MSSPFKYVVDNPPESVHSVSVAPEIGAKYQQLIDANPYRNVDYTMSPWQKLLSKLGFRTGADAWKENMTVQANEYDASILQKAYNENYESPTSQVQRMRAAGLNPDIDGGSSISSGEASPMPEDPSTPMMSQGEESVVMSVANGVMSSLSTALGLVQSGQGIFRNRLQNSILGIEEEQNFNNLAGGMSLMMLPESVHPDGIQNYDWKQAAIANAEKYARAHLPKNMQDKFIAYQERYFNSAPGEGETMEAFKDRISSTKGMYLEENTFWSELSEVMNPIYNDLGDMAEKIYRQRQKADLKEAESIEIGSQASIAGSQTEIAYQNELDGKLMAEAQNAQNKAEAEHESTMAVLNENVNRIVQHLKEASKDGGIKGGFASFALMGITAIQLWISSVGMPSISRSVSSGGSSWSNKNGSASHQSESMSIAW